MTAVYRDVTISVNGIKLEGFSEATVVGAPIAADDGGDVLGTVSYTATGTCLIAAFEVERFASSLMGVPRASATLATLQKRVRYGGRKGRRAIRRLLAHGSAVEIAPMTFVLPRGWLRVGRRHHPEAP